MKKSKLTISHICLADHGGAGGAAYTLHERMLEKSVNSSFFCIRQRHASEHNFKFDITPSKWLFFTLNKIILKFRSKARYSFRAHQIEVIPLEVLLRQFIRKQPDVIIIHYSAEFLAYEDLYQLQKATSALIVFHLLDMGPFTGGCHYSWECQEYENSCTNCPALAIGKRTASRALAAKAVALENLWHLVIAPSGELVLEAARSSLFGHSYIKKVALGVAGGLKVTEEQSRDAFGLSGDEVVIMFGCQKFTDQRKGMPILSEALVKLINFSKKYRRRICLLTVGETKSSQPELSKYFRVINLGPVDRKTLDMAYKAASVFVCPSLEDSGPLMVSEALVAGTPIVGFKTGILPDLIVPFETGVLADEKTSQSLFLALRDFLIFSDGNEKEISEKCLLLGRKKCLAENQAGEFLGAIEEFYSSGIR